MFGMENCKFKAYWSYFTDYAMERMGDFNVLDWAMFKSCLVSFGILVGSCFSGFFKKLKPILTMVFIFTWIFTMIKLFAPLFYEYVEKK